jgi:hypothetical protein
MRVCTEPPSVASRMKGWQLPLEDGQEGQIAVGDDGGSGVDGGVRAALERRLLERGEGDRTWERPRRPVASASRTGATSTLSTSAVAAEPSPGACSTSPVRCRPPSL